MDHRRLRWRPIYVVLDKVLFLTFQRALKTRRRKVLFAYPLCLINQIVPSHDLLTAALVLRAYPYTGLFQRVDLHLLKRKIPRVRSLALGRAVNRRLFFKRNYFSLLVLAVLD